MAAPGATQLPPTLATHLHNTLISAISHLPVVRAVKSLHMCRTTGQSCISKSARGKEARLDRIVGSELELADGEGAREANRTKSEQRGVGGDLNADERARRARDEAADLQHEKDRTGREDEAREGEEEAGLGLERVLEEAEEAELLDERQRLLDQAERAKLLERREGAKLLRLREKAQLRRRGGNTKVLNVLEEVDPAGSESRQAGGVNKTPQNVVCAARGEGQEDRPRCTHGFRFATTSRTSKRPS